MHFKLRPSPDGFTGGQDCFCTHKNTSCNEKYTNLNED
jgi:hypothetical protein